MLPVSPVLLRPVFIANALNARGIPTARGGRWAAMTVSNVLVRA